MRKTALLLATCFGAGYAPLAPGTVGAAVGLIPAVALAGWPLAYAGAACLLFFLGVRASTIAGEILGEKDSPRIVIDEAASMMITLAGLPITGLTVACGFVLNRLLDIVKPFPAGRAERLNGGWGVMTDDLVAGIYSNILVRLILYIWG